VLMRLLSGAAPLAAAGMRARSELATEHGLLTVIRPLLVVSRSELDSVLIAQHVTSRIDASNSDRRYRRNALRDAALPMLDEIYPGYAAALLRSSELAARDADYVESAAREMLPAVTRAVAQAVSIERRWLRDAHPALATRVLRLTLEPLLAADAWRELTFERVETLRRAAHGRTGAHIELPGGFIATVERHAVVVGSATEAKDVHAAPD
jgi:tRNA(Ile)-lysidine synthase